MTESMMTRCAILAAVMASLVGCGSISSTLGLERHVPDETQVVVRPTLTLPPDYDLMPPGTETPVSGDHEVGNTLAGSGAPPKPKKEERGFFGGIFYALNPFSSDDDAPSKTPSAPSADGAPAATSQ